MSDDDDDEFTHDEYEVLFALDDEMTPPAADLVPYLDSGDQNIDAFAEVVRLLDLQLDLLDVMVSSGTLSYEATITARESALETRVAVMDVLAVWQPGVPPEQQF